MEVYKNPCDVFFISDNPNFSESISISVAKNQLKAIDIEGSEWEWQDETNSVRFQYFFEKQGKLRVSVSTRSIQVVPGTTYVVPGGWETCGSAIGTYKQNGNSVQLEFKVSLVCLDSDSFDARIDATLHDDSLEGKLIDKTTKEKTKWVATRISKESQNH